MLKRLLLFFAMALATLPLRGVADDLKIFTEDLPPYNFVKNGKLTGFCPEIVREILKRLDLPDTITVTSWTKAYTLLQMQPNVALFSTTRSKGRESFFKWVGPLASGDRWVLVARKNANMSIANLEEAKKVKHLGCTKDDIREEFLLKHGFTNLLPVDNSSDNPRNLANGTIDLWISSVYECSPIIELAGADMSQFEVVYLFDQEEPPTYIAFSKGTPNDVVAKWQKALDEMKKDGTYQRILSKWQASPRSDNMPQTEEKKSGV